MLWVQREKIFSRWRERFLILTKDYLQCYKRGTAPAQHTEMGTFLFQVSRLHFITHSDLAAGTLE